MKVKNCNNIQDVTLAQDYSLYDWVIKKFKKNSKKLQSIFLPEV